MSWFVYLIESGAGGPIKIGYAREPYARLRTLQTGNPQELRLVMCAEAGNEKHAGTIERRVQAACVNLHIRGEWYQRSALKIAEPILSAIRARAGANSSGSAERVPGQPLPKTADDIERQVQMLLGCPELAAEYPTDIAIANYLGAPVWLVKFSRTVWESSAEVAN